MELLRDSEVRALYITAIRRLRLSSIPYLSLTAMLAAVLLPVHWSNLPHWLRWFGFPFYFPFLIGMEKLEGSREWNVPVDAVAKGGRSAPFGIE